MERRVSPVQGPTLSERMIWKYLPYWPLLAAIFIITLGAGWLYLRYAIPKYEASARIIIQDHKKGSEEAETVSSLDNLSSKKIIENEVEVIQSLTLIDEVVKSLHLYAPVSYEQTFRDRSAYTASPIVVQADSIENYTGDKKVYFDYNPRASDVVIDGQRYALDTWVRTRFGKLRFVANPHFRASMERVLDIKEGKKSFYFSLIPPQKAAFSVSSKLSVSTANKLSTVLNLRYRDEVRERGEDILNHLLQAYNKAIIKDKNLLASNTLAFIDRRLALLERSLDSIERNTQQYRSRRGAVDISNQGKLFLESVNANDQRLNEISMQLSALNQVETYVRSSDRAAGIAPSSLGVNDPVLSQMVSSLHKYEIEYEGLKKYTGENNPILISLADKINKIKPGILENIQTQKKILQADNKHLSSVNRSYSSMLSNIPEKERELIVINREQTTKNEIYNQLLNKREETALAHASTISGNNIIDEARSPFEPVSPKAKIVYTTALLAGLLITAGFIMIKEAFGRKILFRKDIEHLTPIPIIGEIIAERSKNRIVIKGGTRTFIAEQFRKLRMTLDYAGVTPSNNTILVTSSIPGEGKSFVATNLALSLSIGGKKVALLDFDLNNPSLTQKLKIGGSDGISEYLQGKVEIADIIRRSDLDDNLFLLPTGRLPKDPAELIMNGRVSELFNFLQSTFDFVVVDTAPLHPVTDAYLLSRYCGLTLFVIRHGYTPKHFIQRIDEENKINQLKNVAIVFNGIEMRGFGKSYGYGYGYQNEYLSRKTENTRKIVGIDLEKTSI